MLYLLPYMVPTGTYIYSVNNFKRCWNLHRYQLGTRNTKKEAENIIFKKLTSLSLFILLLPAKVTSHCHTILPKNILSSCFSNTETSSGDDLQHKQAYFVKQNSQIVSLIITYFRKVTPA